MKKLILSLVLVLGILTSVFATDYTQDANCVGAWLFTEGSGTTVDDASVNSFTGIFASSGHPAWAAMSGTNAPSYATYMVDFDGTNDYIDMGDQDALSYTTGNFTILSWIYLDAGDCTFINKGHYGDNGYYFQTNASGNLKFYTAGTMTASSSTLNTGQWYHVAFVRDGTNPNKLYINGSEPSYSEQANGANNLVTNYPFQLGQYDTGVLRLNGRMSETAVFSRALSSAEINDIEDTGLLGTKTTSISQVIIIGE